LLYLIKFVKTYQTIGAIASFSVLIN